MVSQQGLKMMPSLDEGTFLAHFCPKSKSGPESFLHSCLAAARTPKYSQGNIILLPLAAIFWRSGVALQERQCGVQKERCSELQILPAVSPPSGLKQKAFFKIFHQGIVLGLQLNPAFEHVTRSRI